MSYGVGQVRTIERVEVEFINPICLQHTHLFGGDDTGYGPALLGIISVPSNIWPNQGGTVAPHIAENLTAWA